MLSLAPEALKSFLKELSKNAQVQSETGQVYYLQNISGIDFPIFLRPNEENKQLQVVLFVPSHIESGSEGDLARLLHYINKEIDLPGFSMDENVNIIFYRLMLPTVNGALTAELLATYLKSMEVIIEMFAGVILNVATNKLSYKEVMQKVQAQSTTFNA